jgi:ribose 5-phosphate isomerase A
MGAEDIEIEAELRTQYKRQAGERAAGLVESGMAVGLGTGSTAIFATRRIAQLLREGLLKGIAGFATSEAVRKEAEQLGIPMMAEEMARPIDLAIDGADEVDPDLDLIKGGGGALLREKIVAQASARVIIVADEGKLSPRLGTLHAVPVEVLAFGWRSQLRYITSLGAQVEVRRKADGTPFMTDSGNMILDCCFGPIDDAPGLAAALSARSGVVEHGLFLGMATDLIIAGRNGIRHLMRQKQVSRSPFPGEKTFIP